MYLNFPFVSHGIPKAFVSHAIPSAGNPDSTNQRTWKSLKFPALLSADPEGARWVESSLDKESKLRGKNMGVDGLQTAGIIQLPILCGSNMANEW